MATAASCRASQTWYPGNYGESVACSNQYCSINGSNYGYNNNGYGYGYNNGYSRYSRKQDTSDYGHRDRDRDSRSGH